MAPTLSAHPVEKRAEYRAVLIKAAPAIDLEGGGHTYPELHKLDPFGILYGETKPDTVN